MNGTVEPTVNTRVACPTRSRAPKFPLPLPLPFLTPATQDNTRAGYLTDEDLLRPWFITISRPQDLSISVLFRADRCLSHLLCFSTRHFLQHLVDTKIGQYNTWFSKHGRTLLKI